MKRAGRWTRLSYLLGWKIRIWRSDLGVLLDDFLAWLRSWWMMPRVEDAWPFGAFSNAARRERLEIFVGIARPRQQVEAYLRRITPRPRVPYALRRHTW